MAVRIRLKRMGRTHRPFYRLCAIDRHSPRDGRVLEELGTYDTSIADTDARAVLKKERVDYWLGVGAQPSDRVAVSIKKYGTNGSHVAKQEAALLTLAEPRKVPDPGAPASLPKKPEELKPDESKSEEARAEAPAADTKAEESKVEEKVEETKTEEKKETAADDSVEAATESSEGTEVANKEEAKEKAPAAE